MCSLLHPHHPGCPPSLHADLVELGERREADDEALRRGKVVLDAVDLARHQLQSRRGRRRLLGMGWVRRLHYYCDCSIRLWALRALLKS